jgi:hypothetical protein
MKYWAQCFKCNVELENLTYKEAEKWYKIHKDHFQGFESNIGEVEQ